MTDLFRILGTPPNKILANQDSKIRLGPLKKDLKSIIESKDYEKAFLRITKAGKNNEDPNFLTGALTAGIIAYNELKTRKTSLQDIAKDAVSKIPKNIQNNLTVSGKDSIRSALSKTLSKMTQ